MAEKKVTELDGFEDYACDFEDDNNEDSFERVDYGELSETDANPDNFL